MNKKGIFFTITAILLSAVILVAFLPTPSSNLQSDELYVTTQIATGNDLVSQITNEYAPAAMRVSGHHALRTISEIEKLRGVTFSQADFEDAFAELMMNGTLTCPGGAPQTTAEACICSLGGSCDPNTAFMRDKSLTTLLYLYAAATERSANIETNFTFLTEDIERLTLFQNNETGPFSVGVNATINYTIITAAATWSGDAYITELIPIRGIEDPLYSVQSQALLGTLVTRPISQSAFLRWNITQIYLAIENKTYVHNPNASSFLQRFYGEDQASPCCGIESFINPQELDPRGTTRENKPYLDWCVLGQSDRCPVTPSNPQSVWNISCISQPGEPFEYFTLDTDHVSRYNITTFEYNGVANNDPRGSECDAIMQSLCSLPEEKRPSYLTCP